MSKISEGSYPNGHIEIIDNSYVFIPNNISSDTDVTIYYTGAIGDVSEDNYYKNASDYINSLLKNEEFDKIVIINNHKDRNIYSSEYLDITSSSNNAIVSKIENDYNVNLSKINTIGASAGDKCALYNFAQLRKDGKEEGFCVITGASEMEYGQTEGHYCSYGPNRAFLKDEDYEYLKNSTVFAFEGADGTEYSYVKELLNHGVNVVLVKCKSDSHDSLSKNPLVDNIFNLLDGETENFIDNRNYTFMRCTDINNNTWEKIDNLDSIVEVENTTKSLKKIKRYNSLKNIGPLKIHTNNNLIASDMSYIENSMNSIRGKIKNSQFLNIKMQSFGDNGVIPGCINEYINKYYDAVGELSSLLEKETLSIVSVGQFVADMDEDLKNKANEI